MSPIQNLYVCPSVDGLACLAHMSNSRRIQIHMFAGAEIVLISNLKASSSCVEHLTCRDDLLRGKFWRFSLHLYFCEPCVRAKIAFNLERSSEFDPVYRTLFALEYPLQKGRVVAGVVPKPCDGELIKYVPQVS